MDKNIQSKSLLIIGGSGSFGKSLTNFFRLKNWVIVNIDHNEHIIKNTTLKPEFETIIVKNNKEIDLVALVEKISIIKNNFNIKSFDCVINAAGGFKTGNINDSSVVKIMSELLEKNLLSAVTAAHLASKFLVNDGLLVFVGSSKVFKENCYGILLYQTAKTALHSFALGLKEKKSYENKCVITLLP